MALTTIVTWVALFLIGFYAGFNFASSKLQKKIKKLNRQIDDLENPEPKQG